METFYINNITEEIHRSNCIYVKNPNIIFLGSFNSSQDAIVYAILGGKSNADGCAHCCPELHTK